MSLHEYSVFEHSRANIGRYLAIGSSILAGIIGYLISAVWRVAADYGVTEQAPDYIVFVSLSAFIYLALYWCFDNVLWKIPKLSLLIGVPNISGKWMCTGKTISKKEVDTPEEWHAEVIISQRWEKIRIYLTTQYSTSESVSASLIKEPDVGIKLMYSYDNKPNINAVSMSRHTGYCELLFSEDLKSAKGLYFNNMGRITHGEMTLQKQEDSNG